MTDPRRDVAERLTQAVERSKEARGRTMRAEAELVRVDAALREARGFIEWICERLWEGSGIDGFDLQDEAENRGLLVKGEPTEEHVEEWGPDTPMFVLRWSDRALAPVADQTGETCKVPPEGWRCTRKPRHEGPCAAVEVEP